MSSVVVPPTDAGHERRGEPHGDGLRRLDPGGGGSGDLTAVAAAPRRRFRRRLRTLCLGAAVLAAAVAAPLAWLWVDWRHERAADRYISDEPARRRVGPAWVAAALGPRAYWLDRDVGFRFAAAHESPAWGALGTFSWATRVWIGTDGDAAGDAPVDEWPTDGDLRGLARLTRVQDLTLVGLRATDATLDDLRRMPHLRAVRLADLPRVTDAGLSALADAAELEAVDLERLPVGNAAIAALWVADKPRLSAVYLRDLHVGDAGVRTVTRAAALRELWLDHLPITDAALDGLGSAAHLTHLTVRAPGVTGSSLDRLAGLDELATADFRGCDLTDAGLRRLPPLRSLLSFSLSGTGVTADGVRAVLGRCPAVREVLLDGTRVDEAAAAPLRRAFPAVRLTIW